MRLRALTAVFAATATLWLAGCSNSTASADAQRAPAAAPAAPVKVARAETRSLPIEIKTIGNVEAFSTITVKAQIGGTLMNVRFQEGDMVGAGDVLLEIDPRPYREAVRQWEANLARDTALLRQAEALTGIMNGTLVSKGGANGRTRR